MGVDITALWAHAGAFAKGVVYMMLGMSFYSMTVAIQVIRSLDIRLPGVAHRRGEGDRMGGVCGRRREHATDQNEKRPRGPWATVLYQPRVSWCRVHDFRTRLGISE